MKMHIIAQTNKEWLCAECKHFLFVVHRADNVLRLRCTNKPCINYHVVAEIKLKTELVGAEIVE